MNRLFSFIILLRSFHELSHILPLAQGARRGRTIASSPCTPGLWRTKSPLRGTFSLSPSATGSGARKRPCKTRPQPTSMWAAPAFGECFSDFDATNAGAVCKSSTQNI
ncbi:hypothetical protein UL79_18275 [Shigella dysenteriae]|uniref:Uncharacterized protein n=2 Tax=Enterobacteriaceae TaxID=543 RepID=A0A090NC93_SHIDY|nr:hypothetical protein WRSd3_03682 [Shigella dysenteriae WRSd3]PQN45772.1 hypothetical protein C5K17_21735 [Shigella dysenteriae]RIG14451.1 hypothetical protein UL56_18865 [Shigella dysenteriae]RIH31977.1 hypothetical protein UL63_18045 [Shigella dysenteriae]RIH38209.1 hypothetical protein UL79_18275 [Shigella dysenteriae]